MNGGLSLHPILQNFDIPSPRSAYPNRVPPLAPPSYLDVSNRLDSVVVAIERQDNPVIIISHQVIFGIWWE